MAKIYTFTQARQNLAKVFAEAEKDGEVRISTQRGKKVFTLRPAKSKGSPLDVPGVDTNITRQEILDSIHESREQDTDERRGSYS